ncbi:MAG: UDP-N-acetylmuramate--L-alanine ligase [Coprococcus sp.]
MYKIDFTKPINVHFIGIGGISMSGLAEILLKEGFKITGSDMKASEITNQLSEMGALINIGQRASNITDDIDLVIYTAAIHKDNEEFAAALSKNIPMLTRAQLLGQIMSNYKYSVAVSGTHGKTTTTSMLSYILMEGDLDPTISVGGMIEAIGGNIRVGNSEYFVTEACEYTNSFHAFNPYISIILNVDADHLDFFSGIEEIAESFHTFATKTPDSGLVVVNGDMDYYDTVTKGLTCRIVTFGEKETNKYSAKNIRFDAFGHPTYTLIIDGNEITDITLNVFGKHNVYNSLSAIAVALELGVSLDAIKTGLLACKGADRRFQYKGTILDNVKVMDDYAHHPTEIAATLAAAKNTDYNELWCIFQPHTYTRTYALLDEFAEALKVCDHVIVADIYAAREKDTGLVSSKELADKIAALGTDAFYLPTFDDIENYILKNCKKNDLLITMGAGNVDSIGNELVKK